MVAHHIHDALAQVRTLRELILEKRLFRGYSGRARMLSGTIALAAAVLLASGLVPRTVPAHLATWSAVLVVSLALNYGALAYSFFFDPTFRRDPAMLKPALDAVPPLAAGGVLSLALIFAGEHNLLFGTWMTMYGLAHVACRHALPPANYAVGLFYLACGALNLLWPGRSFLQPWPMALTFFPGELAGGVILSAIKERPLLRQPENEERPS